MSRENRLLTFLSLSRNGLQFTIIGIEAISIEVHPQEAICSVLVEDGRDSEYICCDTYTLPVNEQFQIPSSDYTFGVGIRSPHENSPLAFSGVNTEFQFPHFRATRDIDDLGESITLTTNDLQIEGSLLLLRLIIGTQSSIIKLYMMSNYMVMYAEPDDMTTTVRATTAATTAITTTARTTTVATTTTVGHTTEDAIHGATTANKTSGNPVLSNKTPVGLIVGIPIGGSVVAVFLVVVVVVVAVAMKKGNHTDDVNTDAYQCYHPYEVVHPKVSVNLHTNEVGVSINPAYGIHVTNPADTSANPAYGIHATNPAYGTDTSANPAYGVHTSANPAYGVHTDTFTNRVNKEDDYCYRL